MAHSLSEDRAKLCERCNSSLIDTLCGSDDDEEDDDWPTSEVRISSLSGTTKGLSCSLCSLLFFVRAKCTVHGEDAGYVLRDTEGSASQFNDETIPETWFLRQFWVFCAGCEEKGKKWKSTSNHFIANIVGSANERNGDQLYGQRIEPNSIDYDAIRAWLSRCERRHGRTCIDIGREDVPAPTHLRLIDCQTRRIVKAEPRWPYVALSYVWGLGRGKDQEKAVNGKLPASLLLTIEDAIRVTKILGLHYIWIDRYCINQEDEKVLRIQINQMDLIYRRSYVTITAAAGQNPSYGLPGVSSTPRRRRPEVKVGKNHLMSFWDKPREPMQLSAWATRAWTFQEYFFLPRRLVFTDEEVYYECRDAEACESFPEKLEHDNYDPFRAGPPRRNGKQDPWNIHKILCEYSKKTLSFEKDAARAFAGVFHEFRRRKHWVEQLWGIPITPFVYSKEHSDTVPSRRSISERFIAGLCWENASFGRRRPHFPSWSWAGWACILDSQHRLSDELDDKGQLGESARPSVLFETKDGQLKTLEESINKEGENWSDSLSHIIHLDTQAISLDIKTHDPNSDDEHYFPKPGVLTSNSPELMGFHSVFEDKDFLLRSAVILQERPSKEEMRKEKKEGSVFGRGEVLGLLLSYLDHWGAFFLLVRRDGGDIVGDGNKKGKGDGDGDGDGDGAGKGTCFRRIGYMCVNDFSTCVVSQKSGRWLAMTEKKAHHVQMCLCGRERRRIRLG